ncbi:FlgO family outer membrane protein [Terrimonas sp. NA20]|uniref:FlgO family outer membrane protein n=1 Tax=Terrimonas ginsenosidimutans TaxID=2908004 RepID=A0ABS9KMJ5_9BACT|nr:FlgO family outer membrane protein [Terrimonas ginsenosidimutans]MCG2613551.1 FlgO family outer membrane protein [Terrimonas ginsenosidimutans]
MRRLSLILSLCVLFFSAVAQKPATVKTPAKEEKYDVILKVNGDELTGKVSEIGDSDIKFTYQGEELAYTLKKVDIIKITFASGRIEFFNKPSLPSEKKDGGGNQAPATQSPSGTGNLESHHNKVAVLPFQFIRDNQDAGEEMGYKVQEDVYAYLNKHSSGLTIIDPRTTNAILVKKGITRETLRGTTMDEICNLLEVEYVVTGGITQNKAAETTSSSGGANASTTYGGNKDKTKVYAYGNSASYQYYSNRVAIDVYTDKNDNIYSENRRGLINTTDGSYSSPLEYLLKRCPLYRK